MRIRSLVQEQGEQEPVISLLKQAPLMTVSLQIARNTGVFHDHQIERCDLIRR